MAQNSVVDVTLETPEESNLELVGEKSGTEKSLVVPARKRVRRKRSTGKRHDRKFNWPKKSLYETTWISSASGTEKNLIHRVFIISRLANGVTNRIEVGNHYEQYFKKMKNDFQSEPVTGLMLIYLKYIVHVMETSADMILEFVRELAASEKKKDILEISKILVISHDIPQRQYQGWNFRTLDIVEPNIEGYEATTSVQEHVIDLLAQLLKLGSYLAKQPKLNLKNAMDTLYDKVPELLPQQAVVHYLLQEKSTCMILPDEYISIYETPFDIILDSDLVWPLPTRLFPYN